MLCRCDPAILSRRTAFVRGSADACKSQGSKLNAARLGRGCSRIRLHRVPVFRRQLRRPLVAAAARPRQRADLSAVAGDLLHLVDVFRLGRICDPHQYRFSRDLSRPDRDDRHLHAAAAPRDPAGEIAEHHLDRRFYWRALRQKPGRRGDGCLHRDRRMRSLHRTPAQGGGVFAGNDPERGQGLLQHSRSSATSRWS